MGILQETTFIILNQIQNQSVIMLADAQFPSINHYFISPESTYYLNDFLFQSSELGSMLSISLRNRPRSKVYQSFLLHAMMNIVKIRIGQVTKLKGTLQGQTYYIPIQITVEHTKDRLPNIVYTPRKVELLFLSQILRQDRVTPGSMMSSTGSHEHFLYRLFTISGTQINSGEASYPAQSLQDLGRMKCRILERIVIPITEMVIERKAYFSDSKQKSLMLPIQMQAAKTPYKIKLSSKNEQVIIPIVSIPLIMSHHLTTQNRGFLKALNKNRVQFQQINTKNMEQTTPPYPVQEKA